MNNRHLYTLLKVIDKNSSVSTLRREGLSFPRIAELTSVAVSLGLVTLTEDKLALSEAGIAKMQELAANYKETNKDKWIEKETKSTTPKIDKDYVYLPNQNALTF